jgi:hypothetical protein
MTMSRTKASSLLSSRNTAALGAWPICGAQTRTKSRFAVVEVPSAVTTKELSTLAVCNECEGLYSHFRGNPGSRSTLTLSVPLPSSAALHSGRKSPSTPDAVAAEALVPTNSSAVELKRGMTVVGKRSRNSPLSYRRVS